MAPWKYVLRRLASINLPLLACLALFGASTTHAATIPAALLPITQVAQPFVGVTHYQITQSLNYPHPAILPRPLSIHIVEIDPSAPGVSFFATPGNGADPQEYTRQTTNSFVNTHDLAVGINGDFYSTDTGAYANATGLGISDGVVASAATTSPAFVVRQNLPPTIVTNGTIPAGARQAVSGNQRIVQNGANVAPNNSYTNTLNPHTAIGFDVANGHVFFMTVDGRQTGFSEGMFTSEMANMLISIGVDHAINLDGGGSTTLAFADNSGGSSRTVNSPSDGSSSVSPGGQRSVANHFGVRATPNPGYVRLPTPPRPGFAPQPVPPNLVVLDGFDGGEGRFISNPPTGSGSTNGITAASTAVYTTSHAHTGAGSQQLTLVRDSSTSARLRHLSGGGSPANNQIEVGGVPSAMGATGYVGFFLKTTDPGLSVGLGVDDGTSGSAGLELGLTKAVIPDGQWRLYEWNLADAAQWTSFAGGNGAIGGPNAYLDSIFLYADASTAGKTLTAFVDTVAYNPAGNLAALVVPEPPCGPIAATAIAALGCRHRTARTLARRQIICRRFWPDGVGESHSLCRRRPRLRTP